MRTNMRLYATLITWVAVMVIMIVLFTASDAVSQDPNMGVFVSMIFGFAATISTAAIWLSAIFDRPQFLDAAQAAEKRKNIERSRMSRLVDRLSENELDELETLLSARDDEFTRARSE